MAAAFVQKDFLEAFFGLWSYVTGGSKMLSELLPFSSKERIQLNEEDRGPPLGDGM